MLGLFDIQETEPALLKKAGATYVLKRNLGQNEQSAVMCAWVEFYLTKNQPSRIEMLWPKTNTQTSTLSNHFTRILKDTLNQNPENSIKYFYDTLRKQDPKNTYAGAFYTDYLSRKFNVLAARSLREGLMQFAKQMEARFVMLRKDGHQSLEINQDCKSPDKIVMYYDGSSHYYLSKQTNNPSKSQSTVGLGENILPQGVCQKCNYNQTNLFQNICQHNYCFKCLDSMFISMRVERVKCQKVGCIHYIQKSDFKEYHKLRIKSYEPQVVEQQESNNLSRSQIPSNTTNQANDSQMQGALCQHCYSPNENMMKTPCGHYYCLVCLSKMFVKSQLYVACKSDYCKGIIYKTTYLELRDSAFKKDPQLKQNQNDDQSQNQEEIQCQKCYSRQPKQLIFQNDACKHKLCKKCLISKFSTGYSVLSICPLWSCNQYIIKSQAEKFLDDYIEQPKVEVYECCECFKPYKVDFLYTHICGKFYCRPCSDKYISKQQSSFICYQCKHNVDVKELQVYFYNQIQQQAQLNCSQCLQGYLQSDMFQNKSCQHNLCFQCIDKNQQDLANTNLHCPVAQCYRKLDADGMEEFYVLKQTEILNQAELAEKQAAEQKKQEQLAIQQSLEEQQQKQKEQQQQQQSRILQKQDKQDNQVKQVKQQEQTEIQPQPQLEQQQQSKIHNKEITSKLQQQEQIVQQESIQQESNQVYSDDEVDNDANQVNQGDQGECSMCKSALNEFNQAIRSKCRQGHKIGVCCQLIVSHCVQCENKPLYPQKWKLMIFTVQQMEQQHSSSVKDLNYSSSYIYRDDSRVNSKIYNAPTSLAQSTLVTRGVTQERYPQQRQFEQYPARVGYSYK